MCQVKVPKVSDPAIMNSVLGVVNEAIEWTPGPGPRGPCTMSRMINMIRNSRDLQ